jgi:dTDP-4-dehydrorhamnose reductase
MKKVLILGDGLLGSELRSQSGFDIISRSVDGFDICDTDTYYKLTNIDHGVVQYMPYDIIINTIGHTDTYSEDKQTHWDVNYKGLADLVDFCNHWKVKLVHIVTDYIYANSKEDATEDDVPVHCRTWYGYTKLLSDAHVQLKCNDYLCVRGTHKTKPFPYETAWTDQVGNFEYVDEMVKIILQLVDKDVSGVINVGSDKKTMHDLALQTKSDVKQSIVPNKIIPTNLTMNLDRRRIFNSYQ